MSNVREWCCLSSSRREQLTAFPSLGKSSVVVSTLLKPLIPFHEDRWSALWLAPPLPSLKLCFVMILHRTRAIQSPRKRTRSNAVCCFIQSSKFFLIRENSLYLSLWVAIPKQFSPPFAPPHRLDAHDEDTHHLQRTRVVKVLAFLLIRTDTPWVFPQLRRVKTSAKNSYGLPSIYYKKLDY